MKVKVIFNDGHDNWNNIDEVKKIVCQGTGKEYWHGLRKGMIVFEYRREWVKSIELS